MKRTKNRAAIVPTAIKANFLLFSLSILALISKAVALTSDATKAQFQNCGNIYFTFALNLKFLGIIDPPPAPVLFPPFPFKRTIPPKIAAPIQTQDGIELRENPPPPFPVPPPYPPPKENGKLDSEAGSVGLSSCEVHPAGSPAAQAGVGYKAEG